MFTFFYCINDKNIGKILDFQFQSLFTIKKGAANFRFTVLYVIFFQIFYYSECIFLVRIPVEIFEIAFFKNQKAKFYHISKTSVTYIYI